MKKILILFLFFLTIGLGHHTYADMGPKPTTTVEIIGLDEPYSFDLLYEVYKDVRLLSEEEVLFQIEYDYYKDDFPSVLNGYQDSDGFASYTLYTSEPHNISQEDTHTFKCGYFSPPNVFKIVLVLESGDMIVSDIVRKTLFNAHFTFNLSDFSITESEYNLEDGNRIYNIDDDFLSEDIPFSRTIIYIVLAVIITILTEAFILFLFMYRKKESYKIIFWVNLITQFLLHGSIIVGGLLGSLFGYIGVLILGEFLILIIETIIYLFLLKERSRINVIFYTLFANISSLLIGIILSSLLLSGIF
jgi:hypothetical protein